ncbi:treacle isoform X6 [Pelobates cultripes]|uniref:Treacle isoform X6 n=1 Tax=Pelobates cultripes TaxID=61616 RepID=A0AAD1RQS7_PELCU|nr:treacle isoform X6 [Pelobates cultripes]
MKSEVSLLALIHQHLLQAGFSKAARELQAQSGEKLLSSRVSLQDIYHDWASRPENAKKRKAIKANEVPSKKLRVSDPKSSSEPSEEEDNAVHGSQKKMKIPPKVTQAKDKKSAVKLTAKVKKQSAAAKNMNSVKQPASEQKSQPTAKPGKKTLTDLVTESSDTSDSEEETKMVSTVPAILKPVLKASDSSESSSSDEAEMETDQKPLIVPSSAAKSVPDATADKKAPSTGASNGTVASPAKAAGKLDATDSSDSEATDIETPNLSVGVFPDHLKIEIPSPAASQIRTSDMASQTTISMSASRAAVLQKVSGSSVSSPKLTEIPKPAVPMPSKSQDDSSSESSESGHEEESVEQKPTAKPSTIKTSVSSKGGKKVVAPVKAPTPIKKPVEESSEDSEEEPKAKKVLTTLQATKVKKVGSSKGATRPVISTAAKASLPMQQLAKDSSDESDSDSEEEPDTKKVVAPVQVTKTKTSASFQVTKQPVTPTPAKAPLTAPDDSSEESDSESEEEPEAKKIVVIPQATDAKNCVSAKGGKQSVPPTPTKVLLPSQQLAEDSSEDSDSDEEPEAKVVIPSQATKAKAIASSKVIKQPVTPTPAKAPLPMQQAAGDSSEESDSDSDEEQVAKKVVAPPQATTAKAIGPSKTSKQPATPAPVKATLSTQQLADDSSEDSDSDNEEELKAKKAEAPPRLTSVSKSTSKQPVTSTLADSSEESDSDSDEEPEAKKAEAPPQLTSVSKSTTKQPVTSTLADSSEESDSDSDEEPEAKKVVAPLPATKAKDGTSKVAKQPVATTPAKINFPMQQHAGDGSEESDSDSDSETETKTVNATLKASTPALKPALQLPKATKGKTGSPAKAATFVRPADESSSDSDSSDSKEEKAGSQKVLPTPAVVKSTLRPLLSSPPLLSSTPSEIKLMKSKSVHSANTPSIVKPSMGNISSGSSDTESDDDLTQITSPVPVAVEKIKEKMPLKSTEPATTILGVVKSNVASAVRKPVAIKGVSSESSDTSDSEDKPAVKKAISSPPGNIPSSHISAAIQSSSEDESDSELVNSQALLKTPLPAQASSPKVKTDKKNKQTSAPNKEKKKNKSKPKGKPTATPAQLSMLESEEETVQALLEGRSPKKNKVKNDGSKKKVSTSKVGTAPVLPEQDHNKHGLTPALPQPLLPVTVTPLPQSEKKSSKKRKLPTEDGLAKKKAKLDKKAKKEKKKGKKSKMVEGEAGVLEPKAKSSKKDKKKPDKKSKKKKKESKDKKKKSGEKTDPEAAQTEGSHISSTDKTSKPKKKKLKTVKVEVLTQ